jgi:hypothetical protein
MRQLMKQKETGVITGWTAYPRVRRSRFRWLLLLGALAAGLLAVPPAYADNAPPPVTPPKAYYLALGDSLAYGTQNAKFDREFPNIDPATFNTGYVDDFGAMMARLSKGIAVINLGCPGETSDTLINGGPTPTTCATDALPLVSAFPLVWLHHPYTTHVQLNDALAFLQAHARQTSPITVDVGGVDLLVTEQQCASAKRRPHDTWVPQVLFGPGSGHNHTHRSQPGLHSREDSPSGTDGRDHRPRPL